MLPVKLALKHCKDYKMSTNKVHQVSKVIITVKFQLSFLEHFKNVRQHLSQNA